MTLPLTLDTGAVLHCSYEGPSEAGGSPTQQVFTLPFFEYIGKAKDFVANSETRSEALSPDIQLIDNPIYLDANMVDVTVSGEPPVFLQMDVYNSGNPAAQFKLYVVQRHTVVR